MWLPVALRPVRFPAPVVGADLIGLVEQLARQPVLCHRFDDRFEVGQRSPYPFGNLRVSADVEDPALDPLVSYESCLVTTHAWGPLEYPVDYDADADEHEVVEFATRLDRAIRAALARDLHPGFDPAHAVEQVVTVEESHVWSLRELWDRLRHRGGSASVPAPRTSPEAAEVVSTG